MFQCPIVIERNFFSWIYLVDLLWLRLCSIAVVSAGNLCGSGHRPSHGCLIGLKRLIWVLFHFIPCIHHIVVCSRIRPVHQSINQLIGFFLLWLTFPSVPEGCCVRAIHSSNLKLFPLALLYFISLFLWQIRFHQNDWVHN